MSKFGTFVMRNGELVEKRLAGPRHGAHGRAAHVISDTMAPVKHMGTGQVIDSKAAFRAATRASGCVEVGTDPAASRPRRMPELKPIAPIVQRAIAELESR